jgi:hypothetical protein
MTVLELLEIGLIVIIFGIGMISGNYLANQLSWWKW